MIAAHLIRPLARRLPYSLTLIMAAASGKNKQAAATVSKRPIPNSAVEEFRKIVAGESESQDPVLWTEENKKQMQRWWAEPQRGQFLVTQCASFLSMLASW